jgi:hypothetical protein
MLYTPLNKLDTTNPPKGGSALKNHAPIEIIVTVICEDMFEKLKMEKTKCRDLD